MLIRLVAGISMALIALFAALAGTYWWWGFVLVLLMVASLEWAEMGSVSKPLLMVILAGGFGLTLAGWWTALPLLLIIPSVPLLYYQDPVLGKDALWSAAGVFWLAIPSALLVFIRMDYGFVALSVLLVGTILQDTLAYCTGYLFGGNTPFTPHLSPNKTWAGFFGGFIGMVLTLVVGGDLLKWPLFITLPAGILLGLTGQAGDLSISALKRLREIDDTGNIIPGHGGVLDSTDALIFNIAVFFPLCRLIETYDLTGNASVVLRVLT